MDYPFEYVERIWKYPNFTRAEIEKLKGKDEKQTTTTSVMEKKNKGGDVDSEEQESERDELKEELDEKEEKILKEIEELEGQMKKDNIKEEEGDISSSTNSSLATLAVNSLLETTDSDVIDRLFPDVNEAEKLAKRRFKIMRECVCTDLSVCSSRSRTSEDSSSSTASTTSEEHTDDEMWFTETSEEEKLEGEEELSPSEGEIKELQSEIEEVKKEPEEDSEEEEEDQSSEEVSTTSDETGSETDEGFDVDEELELLEELLEEKMQTGGKKPEKQPWETDTDESSDDDEEESEEDSEDSDDSDGGDGDDEAEVTEQKTNMEEPTSGESKSKNDKDVKKGKKEDKNKAVEVKSKPVRGKRSNEKEPRISSEPNSTPEHTPETSPTTLSTPTDSLSLSSGSSSLSNSSTSSSSSSSPSETPDSNSVEVSQSASSSSLSSSTSSSTLIWTHSVSTDSLNLTSSATDDDDENSDGVLNFDWNSDDLYGSTGTDEEMERVMDFLDNAMKIVDGVFTETTIAGVEKMPLEMEKYQNFPIPLPDVLKTSREYEMMEEVANPKDKDALPKNYWLVQQLESGHMNTAKIVSRKNPNPENVQALKDLENERKLLNELLPELPDPSHIAKLQDMGYSDEFKFLIYEDFGTDLYQLFDQFHPILHKSPSIFLITYFTFNAIKELHSFDILHGNIRPSAFSVQIEPFNIKITDYSKAKKMTESSFKTTKDMKPDSFSPRVFHKKDSEYDEFVDFESWIYTMIYLCTEHDLPWSNDNAKMLEGKEAFFDDVLDLYYKGCVEAVPIAAGYLADEKLSYEKFIEKMTYVFSVDSMMFSDTDRPLLYHLEAREDKIKKPEDAEGVLDIEHWDPADESDSSDDINTADEKEIFADVWKELGLDKDGNVIEEKVEGSSEKSGKKDQKEKEPKSQAEEQKTQKSSEPRRPEMFEKEKEAPQAAQNAENSELTANNKKESPPQTGNNQTEEMSKAPKEKEEVSRFKKEKDTQANKRDGDKSFSEMTLGELMKETPVSESDPSTFSTSSSSESSATSFSTWTSSSAYSDNPINCLKWDENIRKNRAEVVDYAEMSDGTEKEDFKMYQELVEECIKEDEYSTSSGAEFETEPESEKFDDSDDDEMSSEEEEEKESKTSPKTPGKSSQEKTSQEKTSQEKTAREPKKAEPPKSQAVQDLMKKLLMNQQVEPLTDNEDFE